MNRRRFLLGSAGLAAVAAHGRGAERQAPFSTLFAPKIGLFDRHAADPADQVQFIADQGFRAVEDPKILERPAADQRRILDAVRSNALRFGSFLSYLETERPTFVETNAAFRAELRERMKRAVDAAARFGTRWTTIIPGALDPAKPLAEQTRHVVDNLKACLDVCAPAGLTILIEPLNRVTVPGIFLTRTGQAVELCQAIGNPQVKILFDVFHQQIAEGNLTAHIRQSWPYIDYFQWADVPSRAQPGTGEINFAHLLKLLRSLDYQGMIGLDHTPLDLSPAGERAVIAAYRGLDRGGAP